MSREPVFQFLVRLCASVGGLVATSALVSGLVKNGVAVACCFVPKSSPADGQPAGAGTGPVAPAAAVQLDTTADLPAAARIVAGPAGGEGSCRPDNSSS